MSSTAYTIYDPATGGIIRSGYCGESTLAAQVSEGEALLVGAAGVWGAQRVALDSLMIEDIPPIVPTLDELKAELLALAAQRRWEVECGGIVIGGATVATDDRSKILLTGAAEKARADAEFTTRWKTSAGWVELTAADILAAYSAVFALVNTCFAKEADFGEQIAAAATIDAAEALRADILTFAL